MIMRPKHCSDAPGVQSGEGGAVPTRSLWVKDCGIILAKEAVQSWHYSRTIATNGARYFAVYYDNRFYGCVIFALGCNYNSSSRYGIKSSEIYELSRVALKKGHPFPVSQCVSACIRLFALRNPGVRLLVSYADTAQGHTGQIYRAMNWIPAGRVVDKKAVIFGKFFHARSVESSYGNKARHHIPRLSNIAYIKKYVDAKATWCKSAPKNKFLYPLKRHERDTFEKFRE